MHFTVVLVVLALLGIPSARVVVAMAACLPEAVPANLMDSSKPVRILVASWDSSALLSHVFGILVEERLGVNTTLIDRDALNEKLAETNPELFNSSWSSTATLMAADAADIDLDNWDSAFEVNRTNELYPTVASGINGYLAREGWYMPKYLVDMNPDLQSYISLKEPRLARIFGTNPPSNISAAVQPLNPSAVRDAALASSACQTAAAAANMSACIDTLFASVLGTQSGRGKLHVANFTYWNTYDRHILRGLGLQLDMAEANPPIEANLLQSLQSAYAQRKPWIGYLWEPHAIFSNYSGIDLIRVSLPLWTTECHAKLNQEPPSLPCDYPTLFTRKVWRKRLTEEQPHVNSLAEALRVNTEYMLEMLGELTYRGATTRQAACHWLLAHRSWWEPMVPPVQLLRPTCPPGTEAAKSEPSLRYWTCARCSRGYFNLLPNSTCQPCPSGGQCPGGSAFLVQRNWFYMPKSELANSGIPKLYACDVKSQCCPSGSCELNNVCPAGLAGNFCAECATSGQVKWGKSCWTCKSDATVATLFGVLVGIVGMGIGFVAVGFDLRSRFVPDFVVFYQLVGLLLDPEDRFNVPWLSLFPTFQWISLLEVMFPLAPCALIVSPTARIGLELTLPILVWLVVAASHFGLHLLIISKATISQRLISPVFQSNPKRLHQLFKNRYASLLTVTYLPLIKSSMLVLNCRTLADGHIYLTASPSISCFTGSHIPLAVLGSTLLVLLIVIVPSHVTYRIILLWRAGRLARGKLRHTSTSFASAQPLATGVRQSPTASETTVAKPKLNIPLLCAGFKSRYIIFAPVDFGKLAVNVAIGVLPLRTTAVERLVAAVLLLCVNWVPCFVNYLRKPLRKSLDNHLRAVTLGCILMLSGSGLIRFQDSSNSAAPDPSPYRSAFIAFFLIQPLLLLPWYLMRRWLMATRTRPKRIGLAMVSTKSIMWPGANQPPLPDATNGKTVEAVGEPSSSEQRGQPAGAAVGTSVALNQTMMRAYLLLGDVKDLEADQAEGGT